MVKAMQTTPISNEVSSTPGSEDDQAPPNDSHNLPELPDPAEVGEDGQAAETPTTRNAASSLMQRKTCFFCIRRNACKNVH